MPWRPDFSLVGEHADPRLDGLRDRVAVIRRQDAVVLHMLVRSDFTCTQTGGHLWWRRWSEPREFLVLLGEDPEGQLVLDHWLEGDDLTDELVDWRQGRFRFRDECLDLVWVDGPEAAAIRAGLIGA